MIALIAPLLAACAPIGPAQTEVPDAVVLGKPYDMQNPFAQIVRGARTSPAIYEDRHVIAFLDYAPSSPGHALVISKDSHARNLLEMRDRDLARVMAVARRVGRAEISGLGADGFTLEQNNALSQSVPHLHIHVIPKYRGYTRCIGSGPRMAPPALEPIAVRLRAALAADRGTGVPPRPADDLPAPAAPVTVPWRAVTTDGAPDAAAPAALAAVQLPSHGALLNAVLYLAAGAGPHPTLLLLHGLPGNEQNIDLAQAARRDGWNVLTFHYRGSWGSPGAFSFAHAGEDAQAALAWLREPAQIARYRIDPRRIAVAGHSMGGTLAAQAAAADRAVIGTALIDPADFAAIGRGFVDPAAKAAFVRDELAGDLPPLAGTSEGALLAEIGAVPRALDLVATMPALADRPLLIRGAARALGATATAAAGAARAAGARSLDYAILPTDHSFSDSRIALATALVTWLDTLPR